MILNQRNWARWIGEPDQSRTLNEAPIAAADYANR